MYVTLTPAYGRDYKSAKAALADWDNGKDFVIACFAHPDDGRYVSKSDTAKSADSFSIRYSKLTKIVNIPRTRS